MFFVCTILLEEHNNPYLGMFDLGVDPVICEELL